MSANEYHRELGAMLAKHVEDDLRVQNMILKKLEGIETSQASMLGLLTAFNNVKGFAATMKVAAIVSAWLVLFTGSLATISYWIKEWFRS